MSASRKQQYGVTFRVAKIDSELDYFIRSQRKRGETYTDVLRRLLGLPTWIRNSRGRPIGFRPGREGEEGEEQ